MKKNYSSKILLTFLLFCYSAIVFSQTPSEDGQWSAPIEFGIVPVAVANLPDGKLITWSSQSRLTWVPSGSGMTYTQIFDPFNNDTTLPETTTQTDHDMFCPGINNLSDGRILSAGGTSSQRTSIYDPVTEVWSAAADMNVPRGYQGNVTLSDGSVFTIGGSWEVGPDGNKDAELWTEATGWVNLPGIVSDDFLYNANDLSIETEGAYRADNHVWLWPAPDGKLFHAGPGETMHWIDVIGNNGVGSWMSAGQRGDDTYSVKGTTVMFDIGKILKVGGSRSYDRDTPGKDRSFVIDINGGYGSIPTVIETNNTLAFERTMHNSTVLPNGQVLVTGGLDHAETFTDVGAILTAEIYNPVSNSWRNVAGMATPRTYHSVAILMMDGRVFVGGGGLCDSTPGCENHTDAEIYSPPYLFDASNNLAVRPEITLAPSNADYNTQISVETDTNVSGFSLIRFSAATHSTNNEQRRIPLATVPGTTHTLNIPGRELLPPGYYMLFALDAAGVPSVAKAIQIGSDIPLNTNPSLVLDLKFDDAAGSIATDDSQYGNDATIYDVDNEGATQVENTTSWGTGLFGGALMTDGTLFHSNTIAGIPYSESLGTVDRFITVMAWVNRNEIASNASVFSHDYPEMFFGFHNSLLKWEFNTTEGTASCYAGFTPSSQWVHMAATYDGEMARLYANGVEISARPITGNILVNETDANPDLNAFSASGFYERRTAAEIGQPSNGSGVTDELDGRIDELKVYNKVLSAAEIKAAFQVGEMLPEVPDCPMGTIVAEYNVNATGWVEGNNINAAEGDEIFIRAKDFVGEYLLTTPEVDGNTFRPVTDFDQSTGYQIDTGTKIGDNNGLISVTDAGQYVLTTPSGCPVAITLQVTGMCDPEDAPIETEFRVNGEWNNIYNGQNVIEFTEGTELVMSASPNVNPNTGFNFIIAITLPDGTEVGDNYNLGPLSNLHNGTYTITTEEGCSQNVTLTVVPEDCEALGLVSEYRINFQSWMVGDGTPIDVDEGSQLSLSINPENLIYSIVGPNGFVQNNLIENYVIPAITLDHDGVFTFTTAGGCSVDLEVNVIPIDCSEVQTEYRIDSGQWMINETDVTVEEGSQLSLSIAPNTIPYTITGPNGLFVDQGLGNYVIASVGQEHEGLYTFETVNGCSVTLDVTVSAIDCTNVLSEYRINFEPWVVSATDVTLDEGVQLTLSIEPDDSPYTITFPDGAVESVGANMNFTIPNVDQTHNGDFLFTAQNGCEKTLAVTVNPVDCNLLYTEYRVDTSPWVEQATVAYVDEGSQLMLSVFPNNLPYTITDPSGAVQNVGTIGLGDYTIPVVDPTDAGTYIFTTIGTGCTVALEVEVLNPGCTALNLVPEYSINGGTFVAGSNGISITLEEGDDIVLSALPNTFGGNPLPITITLPDLSVQADNFELTSVTQANNGTYTFATDTGCFATLELTVNPMPVDCTLLNLIPEYAVNGGALQAGTDGGTLTLEEGNSIILSALPDDYNGSTVNVTITLPDTSTQADGYEIASLTPSDSGTYTFTTDTGCFATLELMVNPAPVDCGLLNLVPEYAINGGALQAGTDGGTLTLEEGNSIILSALPDDYNGSTVNVTITLPDTSTQADGYEIASLTPSDSGTYTFTTDTGCSATLELAVNPAPVDCALLNLIPEYAVNGGAPQAGTDGGTLTLEEGNSIILSALPDDYNGSTVIVTITLPDMSTQADGYEINSLTPSNSGTYTFTTDTGCTATLELTVNPATDFCVTLNLVPEYGINGGEMQAGTNGGTITVEEGDSIILSALPDDYNSIPVNVTITLPDTSIQADGHEIASLTPADSGTYTFSTEAGCTATLELVVNATFECTPSSITPEYVVNDETTQSGSGSILLTVGNKLILRIVQDLDFTITLPDGSEVLGEYVIDSVQMIHAGVYSFTSEQGCSIDLNVSVMEEDSTVALKDMIVYPNPVRDGMLHFGLENFMAQEIRVQITDIYGKTVIREIFPVEHQSDELIDISSLSEGTYIVILSRNTDNDVTLKKVIKFGGL